MGEEEGESDREELGRRDRRRRRMGREVENRGGWEKVREQEGGGKR